MNINRLLSESSHLLATSSLNCTAVNNVTRVAVRTFNSTFYVVLWNKIAAIYQFKQIFSFVVDKKNINFDQRVVFDLTIRIDFLKVTTNRWGIVGGSCWFLRSCDALCSQGHARGRRPPSVPFVGGFFDLLEVEGTKFTSVHDAPLTRVQRKDIFKQQTHIS